MKYKVGQRVIGLRGIAKGKTGIIGATWQSGYGVTFPESGNHNMKESSIMGLDEFPTIVELQAQLASMTEKRNQWERIAHGSLEAIERIAATLDIPTRLPDSALGVSYPELEKLIIEALEDMAE